MGDCAKTIADTPRSVAVIDVGATNIDVVQYGRNVQVIDRKSTKAGRYEGSDYSCLDVEGALNFAKQTIQEFDRALPVDAIVPCTHGSAIAALDEHGALVFPVMSYLTPMPESVAEAYASIEPPFSEVFAPTNPGALTLARQLLWFEMSDPAAFSKIRTFVPYAQYIAFRLSGVLASEITSLGAQSHLWAPLNSDFSKLAKSRGWAEMIPPLVAAGDPLGSALEFPLNGKGIVHCGVHDSSASYLQFGHLEPMVLLSTGTWIIAFDSESGLSSLDPSRDQVANVRIDGRPIASARFMGGEEFRSVAGDKNTATPSTSAVQALITDGTMALPSFTDSGGPMPDTGGCGTIAGRTNLSDVERVSLASLYTAMMTAFALNRLGDTQRVIVDGVFAENEVFMALLSALLPERDLFVVRGEGGGARGAALLAIPGCEADVELAFPQKLPFEGLAEYHAAWLKAVQQTSRGRHNAQRT